MSIPRARRYAIAKDIRAELEDTFFLMAINKDFMLSKDITAARTLFPSSVKVRVLRNNLVKKAMEGTDWLPFADRLKGGNMYVFVKKDVDLKATIEASIKMTNIYAREAALAAGLEAMGGASKLSYKLQPCVGGIMADEWNVIEPEDLPKFKDFPTKTELIARIAGGIKQVTTKVAKGVKQVPQKLAVGIKTSSPDIVVILIFKCVYSCWLVFFGVLIYMNICQGTFFKLLDFFFINGTMERIGKFHILQ